MIIETYLTHFFHRTDFNMLSYGTNFNPFLPELFWCPWAGEWGEGVLLNSTTIQAIVIKLGSYLPLFSKD